MISDIFKDIFMPPMVAADRDGGQATEKPEAVTDDNTFTQPDARLTESAYKPAGISC
jgi:hypothetical protein